MFFYKLKKILFYCTHLGYMLETPKMEKLLSTTNRLGMDDTWQMKPQIRLCPRYHNWRFGKTPRNKAIESCSICYLFFPHLQVSNLMVFGCKCVQNYLENLQISVLIKKIQHRNPSNWRQTENNGKKHGQSPEGNSADPIAAINDNIFVIYYCFK